MVNASLPRGPSDATGIGPTAHRARSQCRTNPNFVRIQANARRRVLSGSVCRCAGQRPRRVAHDGAEMRRGDATTRQDVAQKGVAAAHQCPEKASARARILSLLSQTRAASRCPSGSLLPAVPPAPRRPRPPTPLRPRPPARSGRRRHRFPRSHGPAEHKVSEQWLTLPCPADPSSESECRRNRRAAGIGAKPRA
jgi:hypothetical protein